MIITSVDPGKTHKTSFTMQFSILPILFSFVLAVVLILAPFPSASTATAAGSWGKVVDEIESTLGKAVEAYEGGDATRAKDMVNEAYYGPFEEGGMEKAIRLRISSRRAAELEYAFVRLKKLIDRGDSTGVRAAVDNLVEMLRADAAVMGETSPGPWGPFLYSFTIIVREGFEAILILGAIIAYLVKSGNQDKVRTIYHSALAAVGASVVTAVAVKLVFKLSGASQEILEGVTMLLAVVVLFSVSYWLISKVEARKWRDYIEGKVKSSLGTGSRLALWLAAFLAVYREGAETVLFYQALLAGGEGARGPVVLGFVVGSVILVGIFVAIRYGSVRLPLKPFFLGTSLLLYYLAFVFAGEGIKELQEGGLIGVTPVNGVPAVGFLGLYPSREGLFLQFLLLLLAAGGLAYQWVRGRRERLRGKAMA